MRISGGSAKGRVIKAPKGVDLRPSEERVRQALFNILAPVLQGSDFLDLFCGSGAVGLEALSRGAASATFVDVETRCLDNVRLHAQAFGFPEEAVKTQRFKLPDGLPRLAAAGQLYDFVFLDPPYATPEGEAALRALGDLVILKPGGGSRLIFEHPKKLAPPENLGRLARGRRYDYGNSMLSFYMEPGHAD